MGRCLLVLFVLGLLFVVFVAAQQNNTTTAANTTNITIAIINDTNNNGTTNNNVTTNDTTTTNISNINNTANVSLPVAHILEVQVPSELQLRPLRLLDPSSGVDTQVVFASWVHARPSLLPSQLHTTDSANTQATNPNTKSSDTHNPNTRTSNKRSAYGDDEQVFGDFAVECDDENTIQNILSPSALREEERVVRRFFPNELLRDPLSEYPSQLTLPSLGTHALFDGWTEMGTHHLLLVHACDLNIPESSSLNISTNIPSVNQSTTADTVPCANIRRITDEIQQKLRSCKVLFRPFLELYGDVENPARTFSRSNIVMHHQSTIPAWLRMFHVVHRINRLMEYSRVHSHNGVESAKSATSIPVEVPKRSSNRPTVPGHVMPKWSASWDESIRSTSLTLAAKTLSDATSNEVGEAAAEGSFGNEHKDMEHMFATDDLETENSLDSRQQQQVDKAKQNIGAQVSHILDPSFRENLPEGDTDTVGYVHHGFLGTLDAQGEIATMQKDDRRAARHAAAITRLRSMRNSGSDSSTSASNAIPDTSPATPASETAIAIESIDDLANANTDKYNATQVSFLETSNYGGRVCGDNFNQPNHIQRVCDIGGTSHVSAMASLMRVRGDIQQSLLLDLQVAVGTQGAAIIKAVLPPLLLALLTPLIMMLIQLLVPYVCKYLVPPVERAIEPTVILATVGLIDTALGQSIEGTLMQLLGEGMKNILRRALSWSIPKALKKVLPRAIAFYVLNFEAIALAKPIAHGVVHLVTQAFTQQASSVLPTSISSSVQHVLSERLMRYEMCVSCYYYGHYCTECDRTLATNYPPH
eukprot:c11128_g1_i1.p1 GENE.c11128_g1_i1~~c11128_g1_i1.p1  ORF type:complete len:827 (+),score=267.46 c11128_g1_i1:37-2481(+)